MSDSLRAAEIASHGMAYEVLRRALEKYPREMWEFKPVQDG